MDTAHATASGRPAQPHRALLRFSRPPADPMAPFPTVLPSTRLSLLIVAVLAVGPAVPVHGEAQSLGPLASEDGAPLHRVGLTSPAESPDPVTAGDIRWSLGLAYSNIFEQDSTANHVLMVDMERLIKTAQVRVGLSERLEVGGRLTFETTGGGVLDGFVSWWHTRLGVGNANREFFAEGGYDQRLETGSEGTVLAVPRRTAGLEDVRVFTKWRLSGGENSYHALSLRATARMPTSPESQVRERPDVGLSVLGRVSGTRWHGHGMLTMTTVHAISRLGPGFFRDRAYHGLMGVERSLGSSVAAVIQYQVSSPLMASFGHRELEGLSANLIFGVAGRIGETWRWEASFQEDVPSDTPAPDFTLGLRVSRAW